ALPARCLVADHPLPDQADPRLFRVLTGHPGGACTLVWHPDGGRLSSLDLLSGTLWTWDTRSGELDSVVKVTDNTVFRARLSTDGRVLAIAGRRDRTRQVEVQLIDVATASPAAE